MTGDQTELDHLDPAPRPPRRPARRKGKVEASVTRTLKNLPDDLRTGGLAEIALLLARDLDEGGLTPRDTAGHAAQLRHTLVQLHEMAPGQAGSDATEKARNAVEKARNLYAVGD